MNRTSFIPQDTNPRDLTLIDLLEAAAQSTQIDETSPMEVEMTLEFTCHSQLKLAARQYANTLEESLRDVVTPGTALWQLLLHSLPANMTNQVSGVLSNSRNRVYIQFPYILGALQNEADTMRQEIIRVLCNEGESFFMIEVLFDGEVKSVAVQMTINNKKVPAGDIDLSRKGMFGERLLRPNTSAAIERAGTSVSASRKPEFTIIPKAANVIRQRMPHIHDVSTSSTTEDIWSTPSNSGSEGATVTVPSVTVKQPVILNFTDPCFVGHRTIIKRQRSKSDSSDDEKGSGIKNARANVRG